MSKVVLIKDLPKGLVDALGRALAAYTITFIDAATLPAQQLGSGVLVSAGGKKAVLTAQHVVRLIPEAGRFGIFLDQTNTPHTIDRCGVAPVQMPMGAKEHEGPDLGVVILAPSIAGSIAAKKLFFNLDAHRDQALHSPWDLDEGVWCANGFLEELGQVRENDGGQGSTQYFYNFTGFGGPNASPQVGDHDYFEFPVSY